MADDVRGQNGGDLPKIGNPAQRALVAHRHTRLDQLTGVSEAEVAGWHGIGPKARGSLRAVSAARGLAFASGQTAENAVQ